DVLVHGRRDDVLGELVLDVDHLHRRVAGRPGDRPDRALVAVDEALREQDTGRVRVDGATAYLLRPKTSKRTACISPSVASPCAAATSAPVTAPISRPSRTVSAA